MNLRLTSIISPSIYIILFESNKNSPANFSQFSNMPQQNKSKTHQKIWIYGFLFLHLQQKTNNTNDIILWKRNFTHLSVISMTEPTSGGGVI